MRHLLFSRQNFSPLGVIVDRNGHVILSMQLQPGRVLYAVKNDPPVEYSISFITNTL